MDLKNVLTVALKFDRKNYRFEEDGCIFIVEGKKHFKVKFNERNFDIEVLLDETCRKMECKDLSSLVKIGVVSLNALMAAAYLIHGYDAALKVKRNSKIVTA
ncbi:MAG: hypothetical protein NZ895_04880 [Archaeoglobaceae archaeon]|nr:hypothetical protein [Archaeoglobaceae archaeon]MCX8152718.1 hypothetical protein [Archaeoglobaceae archaeon]MDW8013425.1 hypothetical protein [Archaeoglobaceae archaeon]